MRRREFVAGLGSAVAWPMVARGQQSGRAPLLGIMMGFADENDPDAQVRVAALKQALETLGWGKNNLRIELRWTAADVNRATSLARELVEAQPDVIVTQTTQVTDAVHQETNSIPVVFVSVPDPIGRGFVKSLSHPGSNMTGFLNVEASLAEKWLELLKEAAPHTTRVALMFNPQTARYAEYHLRPLQNVGPKLGIAVFPMPIRSDEDIEAGLTKMARDPGGGLILAVDIFLFVHRKTIVELTARHNIPMICPVRDLPADGALMSYGANGIDLLARAASYVDRILRGERPSELPVQAPTKFELVINLKTAKSFGLDLPPSLLARADEVIE